jgi:hypothetical protein
VINAHAGAILEGIAPAETHTTLIDEIRKTGECASNLTAQLLTFSRRKVIRPGRVDLHEVVLRHSADAGASDPREHRVFNRAG